MKNQKNVTIQMLKKANSEEIFEFEQKNRDFFESIIPSRGDKYYEYDYFLQLMDEIVEEQQKGICYLYLIRNESGDMVGRVNLFSIVRGIFQKAEIGFRVGKEYTARGYATGAVKLAVQEAFNRHGLHRLEAGTSPENIGSQIVLIKNGFQFIGRAREVINVNNKWEDGLLLERLNKQR